MIPLRDHNQTNTPPTITHLLILVNSLIFILSMSLPEFRLETFIYNYAIIPNQVIQGRQLYTLFTSMFLHGSLGHLIGNMLFLNIFGDNLEDKLGHLKYLLFYLVCGLGASALQILLTPNVTIPNLGASGAIAGLMGGYLTLFPNNKVDVLFAFGFLIKTATVPAYTMVFYWIIAQFLGSIGQLAVAGAGGVAYLAHIGGFFTGLGIISLLKPALQKRQLSSNRG